MSAKKFPCFLLFIVASIAAAYIPAQSHAAGRDVIVGKGSPTSKRVALTRFHGMANAPKLRLAAIRAKRQAGNK
jgi:hypothetical protein